MSGYQEVPNTNEEDRARAEAIRAYVLREHQRNKLAPRRYPDENGAFPDSWVHSLFQGESLLVVPDANVLRNDIGRACRTGRTVLITAANTGALRLFCAQHVIGEVFEHCEKWALELGVEHRVFVDWWTIEYLSQLRVIPDSALSVDLLSPPEAERVKNLQHEDADDVPSAVLSLVLGAFFMTEDSAAWRAVYGADADSAERFRWLRVLMDGSDASEHLKMAFLAWAVPSLTVNGVYHGVKWLAKEHPWILLGLATALAVVAARTPKETYKLIGSGLLSFGSFFVELFRPYHEALTRFRSMCPPTPNWEELRQTNKRRTVLTRACLYTLARAPSLLAAQEVAHKLPILGVGQDAQLVRETLRTNDCFCQPYRARWQSGRAVRRSTNVSTWVRT